jgi:hypothetical protein
LQDVMVDLGILRDAKSTGLSLQRWTCPSKLDCVVNNTVKKEELTRKTRNCLLELMESSTETPDTIIGYPKGYGYQKDHNQMGSEDLVVERETGKG